MKNFLALLTLALLAPSVGAAQLELARPVRDWEFFSAVGERSAVLGKENGVFEAWVFPLKILKNFRLEFTLNGRAIPAQAVARSVLYRPGSSTIVYSGDYYEDHFLVRQTFVAPRKRNGVLMRLEIDCSAPLRVGVSFERDFTLMWPAGLGGTYGSWDEDLKAFVMGEDQGRFFALAGSPDAVLLEREYGTNYSASPVSRFSLGEFNGPAERLLVIAASFASREALAGAYRDLLRDAAVLETETESFYREYLSDKVRLDLPDDRLRQAYDWSVISMRKGVVVNPFLVGRGLVAGFGLSKGGPRPGFAWFFGRDTCWTTLAMTAAGDLDTARDAIQFIAQFQREDGKIPHEISQSASFVPWFDKLPYAYAAADATALFVIAAGDYAKASGDRAFVEQIWPRITRALDFQRSIEDENGFARNLGVGHGWIEGGPLLPVRTEFYQAGLGVEALRAAAKLASMRGEAELARRLGREFEARRAKLNEVYWLETPQRYAWAIDRRGKRVDEPSVLVTVPMWFGLTDADKSAALLPELAGEAHLADWGTRVISSKSPLFKPAGYHFGSVWPLFTGWASVGQYRYHETGSAYANLQANANLALDGSGGNTTEVVSGAVYSPLSTSSSHQIWSAAMVVSPLLRGLLGLEVDASEKRLSLSPHLPAHWDRFEISNLRFPSGRVSLKFSRDDGTLRVAVENSGSEPIRVVFSPALAPSARISGAEISGRSEIEWKRLEGLRDWHAEFDFEAPPGRSELTADCRGDFALSIPAPLPRLGESSSNLKIVAQDWEQDGSSVRVRLSGLPGRTYRLDVWGGAHVRSVAGARLNEDGKTLDVRIPGDGDGYAQHTVAVELETVAPKR